MIEANSMVQWTECNQNNRFVNPPSLPWLSESSGALRLALPGLTASRLAEEIQVNFKIFKAHCTSNHSTFCFI